MKTVPENRISSTVVFNNSVYNCVFERHSGKNPIFTACGFIPDIPPVFSGILTFRYNREKKELQWLDRKSSEYSELITNCAKGIKECFASDFIAD